MAAAAASVKVPLPFRVIQSVIIVGGGIYLSSLLFPKDVEVCNAMSDYCTMFFIVVCNVARCGCYLYFILECAIRYCWSHRAADHAPDGSWRCTQAIDISCQALTSAMSQGATLKIARMLSMRFHTIQGITSQWYMNARKLAVTLRCWHPLC